MPSTNRHVGASRGRAAARAVVVGGALGASAALTTTGLAVHGLSWVAWISLVPLFFVVRQGRPRGALLGGGFWGACCCAFAALGSGAAALPASTLLGWTIAPALYACCGAALTRRVGYRPVILGIGWILLEVVLKPLGLQQGLLAATQGDGTHIHWLSRLLGYVVVAFLLVCVNASLLAVLSHARLRIPPVRLLTVLSEYAEQCPLSQTSFFVQLWTLRQAYPRAPPRPVALRPAL